MNDHVNWAKVEEIGEGRILWALHHALNNRSIEVIERETGIPARSLRSIRLKGPFEHRKEEPTQANSDSR